MGSSASKPIDIYPATKNTWYAYRPEMLKQVVKNGDLDNGKVTYTNDSILKVIGSHHNDYLRLEAVKLLESYLIDAGKVMPEITAMFTRSDSDRYQVFQALQPYYQDCDPVAVIKTFSTVEYRLAVAQDLSTSLTTAQRAEVISFFTTNYYQDAVTAYLNSAKQKHTRRQLAFIAEIEDGFSKQTKM